MDRSRRGTASKAVTEENANDRQEPFKTGHFPPIRNLAALRQIAREKTKIPIRKTLKFLLRADPQYHVRAKALRARWIKSVSGPPAPRRKNMPLARKRFRHAGLAWKKSSRIAELNL